MFQVSRSSLDAALRALNDQHGGKLVPADATLADWARTEAWTLKQCLSLVRMVEYRSIDFSRPFT